MTTEIASAIEETTAAANPPPLVVETPKKARKTEEDGAKTEDDEDKVGRMKMSPELKKIQAAEDGDFRDVLENIGTDGSFKISVTRIEPEQTRDVQTGRMVKVDGHLKTYTQAIDQEFIASRHGGGKFRLNFLKKAPDGSFKIHTKRVIDIAGDPRTDDVPRNEAPLSTGGTVQQGNNQESPSIVKEVLTVMKDQLDKANERSTNGHSASGPDPAMVMLIDQMRAQNEAQALEMRELRKEMSESRKEPASKTEESEFKNSLVKQLLDGDSTRLNAIRIQFESELRQAKESAKALEDRLRDQFDRDRKEMVSHHQREIAQSEAAHQREIALMKQSAEINTASIKISLDTSKEVLNAQIKQQERELATLRDEVKDLRAKKDKSPLEIAKEYKVLQETYGGDEKADESTVEKIVAALPQAIEVAQGIINRNKPAAAPAQPAAPQQSRLVRDSEGNSFQQRPDGKLIPIKKKGQKVTIAPTAEGQPPTEVEIPAVDPEKLATAISYLEKAFSGNQEPATVATSVRPFLAEEIMQSIQSVGIDVFFAKVAKLPSASPLSSQAGKNWVRKVGKALVGE